MPDLRSIQAMFSASVLNGDRSLLGHFTQAGLRSEDRLSIYRNNFFRVAVGSLSLTYPGIRRLLGDEYFEAVAELFVQASPPKIAWLDDYGRDFPVFLSGYSALNSFAYLADVARLEWLVNEALHAEDRPTLDASALYELDDTLAGSVRFVPHPSFGLLHASFPVDQILAAVLGQDDSEMASIDLDSGSIWLVVHRRESGISIRRVHEQAWRLAQELSCGSRLDLAASTVSGEVDELLAWHLHQGHFSSFSIEQSIEIPGEGK